MNDLMKLKNIVSSEANRFRDLIKNPCCNSDYDEFLFNRIHTLEWVKVMIDKVGYESVGLKVELVQIGSRLVGLKND